MKTDRKIFVLDTNVLIHDPTALQRFKQHDVYLPIVVLEELDAAKVGLSEVARNVRQVSRFIDDLVEHANGEIANGVRLPSHANGEIANGVRLPSHTSNDKVGKLYFYSDAVRSPLPDGLSQKNADNTLLGITLDLSKAHPENEVTLISKDINLRIKAHALGIRAEDYTNDQVLDDADLLYTGAQRLQEDFFEKNKKEIKAETEKGGQKRYRVQDRRRFGWHPNEFLYTEERAFILRASEDNDTALLEPIVDYANGEREVWGIHARNQEQNFALNLLMEPQVDFVTLLGQAGTGKTLLALAVGLAQTLNEKLYNEVIMTRATVPVGEDIGFLPGTEEEKMEPWMGALEDNLDVLHETGTGEHGSWGRAATRDFIRSRIRIKSLNFMRGRTFLKKFIIIDEAQNLSPHQIKTLITRAGPGSKIVCLGNIAQIDTPYLTETTSGLTYAVDRFKDWTHSGHVTLQRGERSRLADYASAIL